VIKRISLLVTAALMAAMMTVAMAAPAFAASPGQQACEDPNQADPGKWTSLGKGQFYCDRSSSVDGPTTNTGNDPQTTNDTNTTPQHGNGIGGGAKDDPIVLHCEYSQSGNLFANKSDANCPNPEPPA
jgi:hypothetical protein